MVRVETDELRGPRIEPRAQRRARSRPEREDERHDREPAFGLGAHVAPVHLHHVDSVQYLLGGELGERLPEARVALVLELFCDCRPPLIRSVRLEGRKEGRERAVRRIDCSVGTCRRRGRGRGRERPRSGRLRDRRAGRAVRKWCADGFVAKN